MRSDGAPALDVTISPTWTGTHTFSATEPRILLNQSGAGANLKLWDFDVAATVLTGRTRTDADGAGKNWLAVTRGATTALASIAFGNATDNPTGSWLGTGAFTFGGSITSTLQVQAQTGGGNTSASFYGTSLYPGLSIKVSSEAANAGIWDLPVAVANQIFYRTNNDANNATRNWLVVTRSTLAVTVMDFGNATDNTAYNFLGTTAPKHGSTTLLQTSVNLTNGAAAQVATMTNGPTAGNPTKWVPINDNGTTRYIPAW